MIYEEGKFESKLSNLIGGSYTNSSKLDLCMTHGGKNEAYIQQIS